MDEGEVENKVGLSEEIVVSLVIFVFGILSVLLPLIGPLFDLAFTQIYLAMRGMKGEYQLLMGGANLLSEADSAVPGPDLLDPFIDTLTYMVIVQLHNHPSKALATVEEAVGAAEMVANMSSMGEGGGSAGEAEGGGISASGAEAEAGAGSAAATPESGVAARGGSAGETGHGGEGHGTEQAGAGGGTSETTVVEEGPGAEARGGGTERGGYGKEGGEAEGGAPGESGEQGAEKTEKELEAERTLQAGNKAFNEEEEEEKIFNPEEAQFKEASALGSGGASEDEEGGEVRRAHAHETEEEIKDRETKERAEANKKLEEERLGPRGADNGKRVDSVAPPDEGSGEDDDGSEEEAEEMSEAA